MSKSYQYRKQMALHLSSSTSLTSIEKFTHLVICSKSIKQITDKKYLKLNEIISVGMGKQVKDKFTRIIYLKSDASSSAETSVVNYVSNEKKDAVESINLSLSAVGITNNYAIFECYSLYSAFRLLQLLSDTFHCLCSVLGLRSIKQLTSDVMIFSFED